MSLHHAPHIRFGQQAYRQALQRMLLCLALLSCAIAGNAQNVTRPNILSPSGIQVNSYTGSLYFQHSDFSIPSRGMDIDISFAYNSAYRNRDWGYGAGWTFNYNIFYLPDSAATGITIYQGDGRQDYYRVSGNNFTQPKGIFTTLTQYQPGKYRLTMKDGSRYDFDDTSHKKLTRITDRYGNKLIFTYTGRRLTGITDSLGHLMTLSWTAANRLDEVKAQAGSETRSVSYTYDTLGMLKQVRRPLGVTMNYVYGPNKGLSGYIDPNGNGTGIFYNSNNAVVKIVSCQLEQRITYNPDQHKTYLTELNDGNTLSTTYEFDAQGRLIHKAGNCCGYDTKYEYDADNNISKTTDGNGGTKLFTYDANGNVLGETDQLGQTTFYTYTAAYNKVASIRDKRGNQTIFTYDAQGNLTRLTDALNNTIAYTYDAFGNRLTETDKKGLITRYSYDSRGYLDMAVGASADTSIFLNDAWGNVQQQTDPLHHTTAFSYDSLDRMTSVRNALQYTTRFSFDNNGNRTSIQDARGKSTTIVYNWQNKPIAIIDPLNRSTIISYDGKGNMLGMTNPAGHTSSFGYDNLNRMITKINGAGDVTQYEYDGIGNKTSVLLPNGNLMRIGYDRLNRVTEITDAIGTIAKYTYDQGANKLTEEDGKGNRVSYRYDAVNRITTRADAKGNTSSYAYDFNDNLVQETDREGHITSYTYDSSDRQTAIIDALNHTTKNVFDKAGNIASVTDAKGNVTRYTYDALNQLTQERFADNTTKLYAYDSVGNLRTRTDNMGQATSFVYDAINRPVLRIYAAGIADTFGYNAAGLLAAANNSDAAIAYAYDRANRVISETLNGKITAYSYNIAGGKKTVTYPGGRSIEQRFDARDQLAAINEAGGQMIAAYEYDAAGRNTKRTFQNGTVTNLTFDVNSQVTELNHNPARFVDLGYSYDKEGNPATAQFRHRSSHTEQYSYDNTYQLTGYNKGGAPAGAFLYDGVGNRTTATLPGGTASYSVNNMNAYSSIVYGSTVTPVYDNNGNLTGNGGANYTYDRENRITAVNGGTTARYSYDALGRRIRKIAGSDTTKYYFSGMQVVEERNGRDSFKATYVWGWWIDDAVFMQRDGQRYFYHTNTLGSVVSVTNAAGAVVERYDYDAFGKATVYDGNFALLTGGSAIGNPYLYTGREYDKESGLYYYRARYYDPVHGRFLQQDPIGYGDGMGVYTYVGNKALRMIDPFGTEGTNSTCDCDKPRNQPDGPQSPENAEDEVKIELSPGEWVLVGVTAAVAIRFGGPIIIAGVAAAGRTGISLIRAGKAAIRRQKPTDFVVTKNGDAVRIPDGAKGPYPPNKGTGMVYRCGEGGKGMDKRVDGVRVMDRNSNQGRRVNWMNGNGQTVDPATARTISNNHPAGHVPLK
jgi:RHS repeat-associated protein